MNWKSIIGIYFAFFFLTIPLTIYLVYHFIVAEILDLIFNKLKLKQLIKRSENIDIEKYESIYRNEVRDRSKLSNSLFIELDIRMKFKELLNKSNNKKYKNYDGIDGEKKIIAAKHLSETFKIK